MATKTLHSGHNGPATAFSGVKTNNIFTGLLATMRAWQERASMRHTLGQLDKEYLNDMGLTSADVATEINKPFWQH